MENSSRELEKNKEKYLNMNRKINDAISKLNEANQYIYDSYSQLAKNYSSDEATKKVNSLNDEFSNVESIINRLSGEILAESERKINEINAQIRKISSGTSTVINKPGGKKINNYEIK